jgi:hypothetical protein
MRALSALTTQAVGITWIGYNAASSSRCSAARPRGRHDHDQQPAEFVGDVAQATVLAAGRQPAANSNLTTIVGPVQQSLALTRAADWVAGLAMPSKLRDVPSDRLPALDLARIFGRHAAAHVVPTIPLEPTAWVVGMKPALVPPDRQGLASTDAEIIKRWVGTGRREFRARKPARGKFVAAISHVLSAEDAEGKHLFRRQLGAKFRIEIAPRRRGEAVSVAALHLVVDGYDFHPFGHHKDFGG